MVVEGIKLCEKPMRMHKGETGKEGETEVKMKAVRQQAMPLVKPTSISSFHGFCPAAIGERVLLSPFHAVVRAYMSTLRPYMVSDFPRIFFSFFLHQLVGIRSIEKRGGQSLFVPGLCIIFARLMTKNAHGTMQPHWMGLTI